MHENTSAVSPRHVPQRSCNAVTYCTLNVSILAACTVCVAESINYSRRCSFNLRGLLEDYNCKRDPRRGKGPKADRFLSLPPLPRPLSPPLSLSLSPSSTADSDLKIPRSRGPAVLNFHDVRFCSSSGLDVRARCETERNNIIEMRLINIAERELARGPRRALSVPG